MPTSYYAWLSAAQLYVEGGNLVYNTVILAGANDSPSAYPEIIAWLVITGWEVQWCLSFVVEELLLDLNVSAAPRGESEDRASLPNCADFICSLQPDVQHFAFAAILSLELFRPVYRKLNRRSLGEIRSAPETYDHDDHIRTGLGTLIANSELQPHVLYDTIESAATTYLRDYMKTHGATTTVPLESAQRPLTLPQDRDALRSIFQEWKQEFDNFEDSLKAGQMELVRQIEHNSRPAAAYEPHIAAQIGTPLYSRLHEMTRRALQLAEYLYHINQEPDGFALTAIKMAQAYENELILRVIWPIVTELQAAGTDTYGAPGKSLEPLIRGGKVPQRSMTLGNVGRYLKEDPVMRGKVSALGFDVDAISRDAAWVSFRRNKAAHELACDRVMADELRRRIVCPESILSRLHPAVAADAAGH